MNTATLALSAELQAALEQIARETGRPEAALVGDAIEWYVRRYRLSRFLSIGAGHSTDVIGENSEDRLLANWKID